MNIPEVPPYLDNIRIILSRTSHPANIGAAARAMKTMGLSRLILVSPNLMATPMTPDPPQFDPTCPSAFRLPEESFILASGAADILEQAQTVATLGEALADTIISCALTGRRRELSAPLHTPRELTPELLSTAGNGYGTALVFGNETFGLSIEEVQQCNRLMTISGNPAYFSLNLAQAVQVAAYEIFSQTGTVMNQLKSEHEPATHAQTEGMIEHWSAVMEQLGLFRRRNGERMMRRIRALFHRASPGREDIDIIRGFLNSISDNRKTGED